MRKILTIALLALSHVAVSQTAQDNKEILEPINALFRGMSTGDSALVHASFTPDASLASISKNKEGVTVVRRDELSKFLIAIGTPHEEKWSEPIWDVKIQMDGTFAQVWAKYGFFIGKQFSHCGVDTFQLIKGTDGKWRIFYLADTRWKDGCNVPPAIAAQATK